MKSDRLVFEKQPIFYACWWKMQHHYSTSMQLHYYDHLPFGRAANLYFPRLWPEYCCSSQPVSLRQLFTRGKLPNSLNATGEGFFLFYDRYTKSMQKNSKRCCTIVRYCNKTSSRRATTRKVWQKMKEIFFNFCSFSWYLLFGAIQRLYRVLRGFLHL